MAASLGASNTARLRDEIRDSKNDLCGCCPCMRLPSHVGGTCENASKRKLLAGMQYAKMRKKTSMNR